MIKGTGIDIVNINRINRIIDKWQDRFLKKIYTKAERAYCEKKGRPGQHYAARFAAKEALLKMLGTGLRQVQWSEIEITNNHLGEPQVKLKGKAAELAQKKEIKEIHISLSHEKDYTVAHVIGEGD